jgi:hypothetical protein
MPLVKLILKDGSETEINVKFNVGDIVKVYSAGHQYDSYTDAFEYFWGKKNGSYSLRCLGGYNRITNLKKNVWIVVNMAVHPWESDMIMYYIRTQDGKKVVIGEDGLEFIKDGAFKKMPDKIIQLN